ncbi:MAG: hypothetical protein KGD64_10310 [Candidatus Heimdallarchaeota archaeon]|nr:hypothetical protein [Candidatus Heimdallarchaeota archaeon]
MLTKQSISRNIIHLLCLILVSSTLIYLNVVVKDSTFQVDADNGSFSDSICLTYDVSQVRNPNFVINSNDSLYIFWERNVYSDNSGSSDQICVQQVAPDGSFIGSAASLVNRSDISDEQLALGCSFPVIDVEDNIHLFWYAMDYNNPQMGFVYYMKLNSTLVTLVDTKQIVNVTQSGIGSGIFGNQIEDVILDSDGFIHLLCCEQRYFYLDLEGNTIDNHTVVYNDYGEVMALEIDNLGNVFLASIKDYDYIYLHHIESNSSGSYLLSTSTVFYNDSILLTDPKLNYIDVNLYISWNADHVTICKKIDYSGVILDEKLMGFNNLGDNFLSSNKSNVVNILLSGYHWTEDGVTFEYSFYSVDGNLLIGPKHILKICYDPLYVYGPDVMYFRCLEDSEGYFWLLWMVNNGNNGFQVHYWKLDYLGNYQIPVTCCAPIYHEYVFSACEIPLVPEFNRTMVSIAAVISLSLLSFALILKKKQKR